MRSCKNACTPEQEQGLKQQRQDSLYATSSAHSRSNGQNSQQSHWQVCQRAKTTQYTACLEKQAHSHIGWPQLKGAPVGPAAQVMLPCFLITQVPVTLFCPWSHVCWPHLERAPVVVQQQRAGAGQPRHTWLQQQAVLHVQVVLIQGVLQPQRGFRV